MIFGFGTFNKRDNTASPTPPPTASATSQTTSTTTGTINAPSSTNPSFGNEEYSTGGGNIKFLPKGLASGTPTTAVSSNSMVYGTTSIKASNSPGNYLNQTFKSKNEYQQSPQPEAYTPSSYAQTQVHPQQQQQQPSPQPHQQQTNQPLSQSSTQEELQAVQAFTNGQPMIITTDETGQTVNASSKNSQPKGKLKITIIEGRDLNATQPYVVCTFESSEFVTNAAESFGKSPSLLAHQPSHHPKNHVNANHHSGIPKALPMRSSSMLLANNNSSRPSLYQRQLSTPHLNLSNESTNPIWNHDAIFDVVGSKSELDISVYDAAKDDAFLGHVRISPSTTVNKKSSSEWLQLGARIVGERVISGAIQIRWEYTSLDKKKSYGPDDFEFLRLLGKGTFGQVFQVKKKDTGRIYAMKVLSKKVIVKKKEIAHTIGERNILVRTSAAASPFIVGLKFSFQTPTDLYLVTDYMSGGELFWHLQKEGRFAEDRAKFYIAELILALEHLHDNDIVYRDLKPENILLDANGHIALCDFGLSKANLNNDGTTNTFCGTTEYLAPEVLLDESGYTKMVDFWSLGVLIFEMCCGWSPFYADNTQQMYKNIAFGKVRFPKEVLSPEGRAFVKGLLNRNPKHRLGATNDARELRAHAFFNDIDWELLRKKSIPPPFKPHITSETDTSNFDPEFTSESTTSILKKQQLEMASTTPLSPGVQANFKGFTYIDDSAMDDHFFGNNKSYRMNAFKGPGSFIPGNPNLPPDEDVIDEEIAEEDEMEIDEAEEEDHQMDYEFVNGRFDL
ncbi:SCH9 [[Candida] subhashii]|uniref:Serine/threonine-protein kinase SCH9 n=1 Tax=[Candida] subhashii TaxID=561895 RepID=A0A8J5QRJ6_9ASCO|nr:SCH9 [[Candida] subhashii]KAG7665381.1 SCH9 [[Candida] subhashii]